MKARTCLALISLLLASAAGLSLAVAAAGTQAVPSAVALVNRMNGAYRSLESFSDTSHITRRVGEKDGRGTLTLAMQKPNKMLVELKGSGLNTVITSDGESLIATRPDRKVYTKAKAPARIIGSDIIGKVDVPSLGARIIAQLLAGQGRAGELGSRLLNAKVTGPESVSGRQDYALTFPYGEDTEARVYVSAGDYLIRRVTITKGDAVQWSESHDDIQTGRPLPPATFSRSLPEGARLADALPPLEEPVQTAIADGAPPAAGTASAPISKDAALAIYNTNGCGNCHSGQAPNLSREGGKPGRTAAWITDQIKDPISHNAGSRMPGFAGRIADSDIDTLARYLASLK